MPTDDSATTTPHHRFESALAAWVEAEERGEPLNLAQVLLKSPELEAPLAEFFRARKVFDRLAPQLAPMAALPGLVTPSAELLPGSSFAGYEIIRELGRGGMGI